MVVTLRSAFYSLTILVTAASASTASGPPRDKKAADYADPKTTYRTYIEAVRKNDAQAAKKCWVIDDDNKSGALDVIVGLWISTRQLNQVAVRKLGKAVGRAIPEGWRRDDVTDRALDLTSKRLAAAEVKVSGNTAQLKINWKKDDGYPNAAFEFGDDPTTFRKVGAKWKIDANAMTGLKRGADFFEPGSWGPVLRDQVAIIDEVVGALEKGKLKTSRELADFIEGKVAAMTKKYEDEGKKRAKTSKHD